MSFIKLHKAISIVLILIGFCLLFLNLFYKNNLPSQWQIYLNKNLGTQDIFKLYDEIVFDSNNLYFNSENHNTYSVNQQSGQINWIFNGQDHSPFPPAIADNLLIIASFDGYIYGLNKKTGQELWHYQIPDSTVPDTPISFSMNNKLIFFGTRKGNLIALESESGSLVWQVNLPAIDNTKTYDTPPIHFGAIWTEDEKLYTVHAPSNSLISFNQNDGSKNWTSNNFKFTYNKPVFKNGNAIFKHSNLISSVNISNGQSTTITIDNAESWEILIRDLGSDFDSILIGDKKNLQSFKPDLSYKHGQFESQNIDINWGTNLASLSLGQKFNIQKNATSIYKLDPLTALPTQELNLPLPPFTSGLYNQNQLILGNSSGNIIGVDANSWTEIFSQKLDYKIIKFFNTNDGYLVITQKPNSYFGFALIDFDGKRIWEFTPSQPLNQENFYFWKNRFYFTSSDERLLESFTVSKKSPVNSKAKQINFKYFQNEVEQNPYLEIRLEPTKQTEPSKLSKLKYLIKNFNKLHTFNHSVIKDGNIHQFKIEHHDQFYRNPQLDVTVEAEITNLDTKEKMKLNGYYSARNLWQINFLPKSNGNYQISIYVKTPFSISLHREKFLIDNSDYNPLSVNDNNFVDSQNKIFQPIGIEDTFIDWEYDGDYLNQIQASELPQPTQERSKYSYQKWQTHLETFFQESQINLYRYGVENWTPALSYKMAEGIFQPSLKGGKFGDTLVSTLKNIDVRIMMTIFGFHPPYDSDLEIKNPKNQQALRQYLNYVVARYSAYVDIWEIGNEANSDQAFYQFVVPYLRKIDPYQHPVSTNWEEPSNKLFDYVSAHHYENPNTDFATISNSLMSFRDLNKEKPVIISEYGLKKVSWYNKSLTQFRVTSWLATFQKIGLIIWNQGQNGIYQNPDNANLYLGPMERTILRNLRNFFPELENPTTTSNFLIDETELKVYTLSNEKHYLAYILNLDEKSQSGYFKIPVPAGNEVLLIDPATESVIQTFITREDNENFLLPLIAEDLAIRVNLN